MLFLTDEAPNRVGRCEPFNFALCSRRQQACLLNSAELDAGIVIPTAALSVLALLLLLGWRRVANRRSVAAEPAGPPAHAVAAGAANESDADIVVLKAVAVADLSNEESDDDFENEGESTESNPDSHKLSKVELIYEEEAELEEVTSPFARILFSAAGGTDRGAIRTRNEDSLLVFDRHSLFAVADGVGGYRGGEVASALAIDTLQQAFETGVFEGKIAHQQKLPRRAQELACAVQMGNQAIRAVAKLDPELEQMGSTLVAARFSPNKQRVYIGHVGDSRCYRLRAGVLHQLTTDHTLGALGVKGVHAQELIQSMGGKPAIAIDLIIDKPISGDLYLLCTDGLSKMLPDPEICSILLAEEDLERAVQRLIDQANQRGGKDNVTLVVIKVVSRAADALTLSV